VAATATVGRPEGSLDLHEQSSDPRRQDPCCCGPEHLALRSNRGDFRRPRGRAVNRCAYCAKLQAIENAEVLYLDAVATGGPTLWVVLTTRSDDPDPAAFYRSREQVWKAIRRRWPDAENACLREFSTGYGERSGGRRRPHWNLMLKGIDVADVDELRYLVVRVWCAREDALPEAQHVGTVYAVGGLMRYLAMHFQKESQAPPSGWKGHRFTTSRGYFGGRSVAGLRCEARAVLRAKRDVWEARRRLGSGADARLVELETHAVREEREATSWELVSARRRRDPRTGFRSAVFVPGAPVAVTPSRTSLAFRRRSWLVSGAPYG
jgi:hypothetical protein